MQQQHQRGGCFELPPGGTCYVIGSVGAAKLAYATLRNVSESHIVEWLHCVVKATRSELG